MYVDGKHKLIVCFGQELDNSMNAGTHTLKLWIFYAHILTKLGLSLVLSMVGRAAVIQDPQGKNCSLCVHSYQPPDHLILMWLIRLITENDAMTTLTFQNTEFDVVDRSGNTWLKAADIARALGYKKVDAVTQIYDRNSDEFTEAMSQTLNLSVSGKINGLQNITVRIFSLRGAHLIAMFARTALAKAFRKWVLDILDAVTAPASKTTADTRTPIRDAVNLLVGKKHLMYPDAYSMIHQRFNVAHIEDLPAEQIPQVVEYVHRMAMEGEWLPAEKSPLTLTSDEKANLPSLISHARFMRSAWKEIAPALKSLESPLLKKYEHHFSESGVLISFLGRIETVCLGNN